MTAVNDHVRLQPTRKLQFPMQVCHLAEVAVFPFGRIKYGLWQVLYLPPSSQNHRLSAGAPDCTAPIDPLLQLSDLTWFWCVACYLLALAHRLWWSLMWISQQNLVGALGGLYMHSRNGMTKCLSSESSCTHCNSRKVSRVKSKNFWKQVWISLYSCVCWPSWAPHAENAGTQSEDCCLTVIWRDASVREACQIVGAGTKEIASTIEQMAGSLWSM